MTIPNALAKTIGSPQRIFRTLVIDGLDILIRLQKPWEEPPEDVGFAFKMDTTTGAITPLEEEEWLEYGTCLIVEAWSDTTQSVMTQGIRKGEEQTDEEFAFGVRYMLNHGTDEQWLAILQQRDLDKTFKIACTNNNPKFVEPTVKIKKKKK